MTSKSVKLRFPVRLQKAIKDSEKQTEPMRSNRTRILERYASGYYSVMSETKSRPINMVWRYINTMLPMLVGRSSKAKVEATKNSQYRATAKLLEGALDHLREEIGYFHTMRALVFDALTGVAVSKTGMCPRNTIEIGGHTFQAGQPYLDRVDFDDLRFDVTAKSRHDMRFIGNRYRLPMWYIRESGEYKNFEKLNPATKAYDSDFSPEKITKENIGDTEFRELQDYATVYDIWLEDEGILVTVPEEGEGDKYLKVTDEFPEKGPYDFLSFHDMPGSPIPIPPAFAILDLDDQLNRLLRKIQSKIDGEKSILAYAGNAAADAQRIVDAMDGDSVRVDDIEQMKEITFGGASNQSLEIAQWVRDHVSEQGGNIDMLAGARQEAGTLGQEQMMQANATKVIDDMVSATHRFAGGIEQKIAWYLIYDPLVQIPMVREIKGIGPRTVTYSEDTKEGDFLDYNFSIAPYSMITNNPQLMYTKLMQWMSQVIMPLIPIAATQGSSVNIDMLVQTAAEYLDINGVDQLWRPAKPQQATPGPYQPQQGKVKSGQPDGRFGGDDGMANHNQQQARAGGMSSVDSATVGV